MNIKHFLLPIVALLTFCSCSNYHYDEELREKVAKEGREKTQAWFRQHKPEAKNITTDIEYVNVWNYISNLVNGSYKTDSLEWRYVFNYDTQECYTNERIPELLDSIRAGMEAQHVPDSIIEEYRYVRKIAGQTISNKTDFPYTHYYSEIEREDITISECMLPWDATDEDLRRIVKEELKKKQNDEQ